MAFEWDEDKRARNLDKHGVDFVDAVLLFDGPTLERVDARRSYGETRVVALGEVNGIVLCVVYAPRGETVRIISARKASRHERQAYYARIAQPD